jgi:hypothetical protein
MKMNIMMFVIFTKASYKSPPTSYDTIEYYKKRYEMCLLFSDGILVRKKLPETRRSWDY